ncbi:unnamed protein product [Rotaria sordida]|uniref:Uncharacterized protein n=1 Tax=Rotaria sordida TaxID=392033 RepID=A0A819DX86_9BILA|nr:unnamed protein product [Rotaria sordida]
MKNIKFDSLTTAENFVRITITQSYSWSFPTIKCANDVPITTSGRSGENDNLTCVVDCGSDGGYSSKPINILTDCISSSSSLGMMTSERKSNITLSAGAHFSIAYQGSAWRALGSPAKSGLDWSIVCSIDLIKRPDGFINTPPVATVVSPQYVIVNRTTQIKIPTSDANAGDDVRCRWSVYQQGYRRRRREDQNEIDMYYKRDLIDDEIVQLRRRRRETKGCDDDDCKSRCKKDCKCSCNICKGTTCSGDKCKPSEDQYYCPSTATTTKTTKITTTGLSTTSVSTTSETPGTGFI